MATKETNIQTREPEIFAAGDTLLFQRYLPKFLPGDGWSIRYVLTDLKAIPVKEFDSVVSPLEGSMHLVDIDDFASDLEAGEYVLTGQAVNGAEKHQIYYGTLTLQPDLADGAGDQPVQTEAQEMIVLLRNSLKELYKKLFQETDVQRSRFVMQKQKEVREELAYWKEVRQNEIQQERARNGRPIGNVSVPVFNIG
jgi:hypothetical protein